MAKLTQIGPGRYRLLCDCRYEKREVTDSEVYFRCERPQADPGDKGCLIVHDLHKLVAEYKKRVEVAEAEKFIASHEEKLEKAKAILSLVPPTATASDAVAVTGELKLVEKPKRRKKTDENG